MTAVVGVRGADRVAIASMPSSASVARTTSPATSSPSGAATATERPSRAAPTAVRVCVNCISHDRALRRTEEATDDPRRHRSNDARRSCSCPRYRDRPHRDGCAVRLRQREGDVATWIGAAQQMRRVIDLSARRHTC